MVVAAETRECGRPKVPAGAVLRYSHAHRPGGESYSAADGGRIVAVNGCERRWAGRGIAVGVAGVVGVFDHARFRARANEAVPRSVDSLLLDRSADRLFRRRARAPGDGEAVRRRRL